MSRFGTTGACTFVPAGINLYNRKLKESYSQAELIFYETQLCCVCYRPITPM